MLLSLDIMYPQIVLHCIDDDMIDIDGPCFGLLLVISDTGLCVWCIVIFGYVVSTDNISLHRG